MLDEIARPRAWAEDEVIDRFIKSAQNIAAYWSKQRKYSRLDMCEGVAFSLLSLLDGCTMALPRMKLVLDPHPEDKEFLQSEGENWFEPGMEIDTVLHEQFFKKDLS